MSDQTKNSEYAGSAKPTPNAGPYLARVIGHLDDKYMGSLEVEILRDISPGATAEGKPIRAKMLTPFFGTTFSGTPQTENNTYDETQKSYGMWFVPPDVGSLVMVIYVRGNSADPYWFGCIPSEGMNFSVPGLAATEYVVEGGGRIPVAEFNKKANSQVQDATKIKKPRHRIADVLETQGLLKDDTRGITTSSARREFPSAVFGISTPGPVDKKGPSAKQGKVGEQANVPKSRLGGTTLVMDDGDDKFIRKTSAETGPPEYIGKELGNAGGDPGIPHNELFRIRTRTGHQILLHNSEDLIYIGNAKGTTWIEMTSNGKIDIYAKDSVSVHTENDINFTADRDINMTAKGNINFNSTGLTNLSSTGNFNINSAGAANITAAGASNINAGTHTETAGTINMNGPVAAKAVKAPKAVRIPTAEPWKGHENLDPALFTPAKTKAVVPAAGANPVEAKIPTPEKFGKYTTETDTFANVKGPEPQE